MIRSIIAALALLPLPAAGFGVPLCDDANYIMALKAEHNWSVMPFAVAERGTVAYLALGPNGQVEIFAVMPGGVACLVFGGAQVSDDFTPAEPSIEQRDG